MQDPLTMLKSLRRPRLLMRAARIGAQDYSRARHLRRVLRCETLPRSGEALMRLIDLEAGHNEMRQADNAGYSLPRHLDVLIAVVGEAQLLSASRLHVVE